MECNEIKEKLSDYMDDLLSPEEKALVEQHLNVCSGCKTALEELEQTVMSMKGIEDLDPPPWLEQKIMAEVREEAEKKKGMVHKLFPGINFTIPVRAAAAVAVCVVGFLVFRTMEKEMKDIDVKPDAQTIAPQSSSEAMSDKVAKALVIKKEAEEPAPASPASPVRKHRAGVPDVKEEVIQSGTSVLLPPGQGEKDIAGFMKQSDTPSEEKESQYEQSPSSGTAGLRPEGRAGYDVQDYRSYSTESTGERRGRDTLEPMINALNSEDRMDRLSAGRALGEYKDTVAVDALIRALNDPDAEVRSEAALALGNIKDRRSVGPLIHTLNDDSALVRSSAARALGRIGDTRAVAPLTDALGDADVSVRNSADSSLKDIKTSPDFQ
jgi:hypothetical protein